MQRNTSAGAGVQRHGGGETIPSCWMGDSDGMAPPRPVPRRGREARGLRRCKQRKMWCACSKCLFVEWRFGGKSHTTKSTVFTLCQAFTGLTALKVHFFATTRHPGD